MKAVLLTLVALLGLAAVPPAGAAARRTHPRPAPSAKSSSPSAKPVQPPPPALPAPAPLASAPSAPDAGSVEVKPLSYTREAKPTEVKLGEPFLYGIVFTHVPTQRYELRTPKDLGAFELEETSRSRQDAPASSRTTFRLKLALFELGGKQIPDLTFDVVSPVGLHTFVVPGVEVQGLSSLPKNSDAKGAALLDIKPPEDVPLKSYRLLWAALAVLSAAAAGYFLWRYLQRPRTPKPARAVPVLPLDVRTRKALDGLKAENLPAQGRGREFFFRLSDILRGYLGQRYGFEALECTSAELLARVEALRARELPFSELRHFVGESDFVKFAKREPSADECAEALDFGYLLVSRTFVAAPSPASPDHASGPVLS